MQYITIQGDTFDLIAKKELKNELLASELMRANPDLLDYVIFPAGVKVTIPFVEQNKKHFDKLPPWRKQI